MQKLYAGPQQQYNYKIEEQIVPQGIAFFPQIGKKHFPSQQRGEIDSYQGMYHLFDQPKRLAPDYDRSLNTKDIDGAVTNTLKSKVVKNMELAQTLKQEKQKSLWEQNSKPISDIEYQPRKKWDDIDPSKNRSAIYPTLEEQRYQPDQKSIERVSHPIEPYNSQQQYVALQGSHSQPDLQIDQQQLNQNYQQQQQPQPQHTQSSSYQQAQQQAQFFIEDDRAKQQQLLMQKQWDQQRLESLQKYQQFQIDKIREQQQVKQQQDIDQQIIAEQRQLSLNQKQQYARDLRIQQDLNKESYRKGFTPPPVTKSEMINQLLQPPSAQQKSQGFQPEPQQQSIRDSLSQQIEENDKRIMINRFRPHELQQYIYDMKNGRIGGGKSRNNPTYMSYAGQQLVNQ